MGHQSNKSTRSNNLSHHGGRSSKNAYKVGKLSKKSRFSTRKVNHKLIFVLSAIVLSFVAAMILSNYLGKKVEKSQGTTTPDTIQGIVMPTPDKALPTDKLNAYFVDFTSALPPDKVNDNSLSNQTGEAREKGNAFFVEFFYENGDFLYSSAASEELQIPYRENLTLTRLENHFKYYQDYALGYLKSKFSANLNASERTKTQANEILLLSEASEKAFSQLVVEFSDNITKNNLIHYQTYLLNLKLACENTPIGIKIPLSLVTNASNHGVLAQLMEIADFYVLDFSGKSAEQISEILSPLAFLNQKYSITAILSSTEETLSTRIEALKNAGINNYIVK